MKQPIIGITPKTFSEHDIGIRQLYMERILAVGGLPLLLPLTENTALIEQLVSVCDGILLSGGVDICPEIFGEPIHSYCGQIDDKRDAFELSLTHLALEADLPILGICRGVQLLNVALGGSLYQDIPSQLENTVCHHAQSGTAYHAVSVFSALYDILGCESINVNSFHHQSVKALGKGLAITAMTEDDVVEGICLPDRKFVHGVQWHPELLTDDNSSLIFESFVRTAQN